MVLKMYRAQKCRQYPEVEVNGYGWHGFYHNIQTLFLQLQRIWQGLTLTFETSLFRIKPETYKHQYKEADSTAKPDDRWKVAKKITCKPYGKNSFCQISEKSSNMFLSFCNNFTHWLKYNISFFNCQGENRYRCYLGDHGQKSLERRLKSATPGANGVARFSVRLLMGENKEIITGKTG